MDFSGRGTPLSEDGFKSRTDRLGIDLASLWAVVRVETSGVGFLPDRRPQILFERHVFARQTAGRFNATNPAISNPDPGGYGLRGAPQYARLADAIQLDRRAALRSASWGLGQVMGFHAEALGYQDVEAMVASMTAAEDEQLRAMTVFIENTGLHHSLQREDWAAFARGYNGSGFAANRYDEKLRQEYARLRAGDLPDLRVRAAQVYLGYAGFDPGPVDGVIGSRTQAALRKFQSNADLVATGVLDDDTFRRLASA